MSTTKVQLAHKFWAQMYWSIKVLKYLSTKVVKYQWQIKNKKEQMCLGILKGIFMLSYMNFKYFSLYNICLKFKTNIYKKMKMWILQKLQGIEKVYYPKIKSVVLNWVYFSKWKSIFKKNKNKICLTLTQDTSGQQLFNFSQ